MPTKFKVRIGDILSVSILISLITLTSDLLTSNLVHVIDRGVGNFPTNLGDSGTFRSRLIGQHLSDEPRYLATLTMEITALVGATRLLRAPYVYRI